MTGSEWGQLVAGGATVLLLLGAAASDLMRYRISNRIVLAVVAAFLAAALFKWSLPYFGWSLAAALVMFLLGAGLFAFGLFGGGDVKLIAAMALWTGLSDLSRFLLVMTVAGGLLGAAWLVRRRLQGAASAGGAAPSGDVQPQPAIPNKIPYGVAIAIAGLDFFARSPHSPFQHLWSLAAQ